MLPGERSGAARAGQVRAPHPAVLGHTSVVETLAGEAIPVDRDVLALTTYDWTFIPAGMARPIAPGPAPVQSLGTLRPRPAPAEPPPLVDPHSPVEHPRWSSPHSPVEHHSPVELVETMSTPVEPPVVESPLAGRACRDHDHAGRAPRWSSHHSPVELVETMTTPVEWVTVGA